MALETLREQITAERFGSARMVAFINRKLDEVVEDYADVNTIIVEARRI